MKIPNWRARVGGLEFAVALGLLFFLVPTLWFPLNRDQATFALGGQTTARGAALYRDFWDIKPPAIYWVYALPARFFAAHLSATIAALDACALLLSAFLLARLSQQWERGVAALSAGAWLVVLSLEPGFSNLGQAETFANIALLGAALWTTSPEFSSPFSQIKAFGSGFLAGVALCFKPTCILPLLPLFFWRKPAFRNLLTFVVGVLSAPLVAWLLLSASGGLPDYLEIQKLLVVPYVRDFQPSFADHALGLLAHGAFWAQRLWLAAIFAALALIEREKVARRAHLSAVLWFSGGFVALWVQNRSFAYQWTPMLPAFAFLAASGSIALGEKLGFSPRKCALWAALLPLTWGGVRELSTWHDLIGYARGDISHAVWLARFNTLDEAKTPSALPAAFATAKFIRARSKSGDGLEVWAYEPEIYLETGLQPPHSFYLHQPLITKNAPAKWRDSAWQAMRNRPPKFIVLAKGDDNRWFGAPPGDSATLWRSTAIYPWFLQHYQLASHFGRFEVYELKSQVSTRKTASR